MTAHYGMQHNLIACTQPMPPRRHRPTPANLPRPPRTMPSLSLRQRRLRLSPQATWTRSPSVHGSGAAPSTAPTRRACSVQIRASTRTTGRAMCRLTATRETTPTAAGWRRLSLGRCPMRSADCRAGRRSRKCTCILPAARHSGHFAFQEYRCSSLLALGRPACASHPSRTTFLQRCRSRSQGLRREHWPRRHSAFGNVLVVRTHLPVRPPHLANDSAAETCGRGNRIAHTSWCVCTRCDSTAQSGPHDGRRAAQSLAASPSHRRPMVGGGGCDRRLHGTDLVRPAAPAPSMRSESAVAGLLVQMGWAGRCLLSWAGSPNWWICKSPFSCMRRMRLCSEWPRRSALRMRLGLAGAVGCL
jgi:hypothetical protein